MYQYGIESVDRREDRNDTEPPGDSGFVYRSCQLAFFPQGQFNIVV